MESVERVEPEQWTCSANDVLHISIGKWKNKEHKNQSIAIVFYFLLLWKKCKEVNKKRSNTNDSYTFYFMCIK